MLPGSDGAARLTRRAAVGSGVAWVGACGHAHAQALQPAPSDAFVDSVGVCTHLSSAPYNREVNAILALLRQLCVRHARDELRPDDDLDRWRDLHHAAGLRAHLLVSPATSTVGDVVRTIERLGPPLVSAIEGQNEGDSAWFGAQPAAEHGWAKAVIDYQRAAYTAIRMRWSRAVLPIVSPTVLDYRPQDMRAIAAAAPFCDLVGLHAYPQQWRMPETTEPYAALAWYLREMRDRFKPGAPAMITETGYPTLRGGISPRAAAIYLPRLLLHAFGRGVVRTFVYELLDEGSADDPEQRYGLVDSLMRPKPAFTALATLLRALADPGPPHQPNLFAARIERAPPDLLMMPFGRRDGSLVLALWRAVPSYDVGASREIVVEPVEIVLSVPDHVRRAEQVSLAHEGGWTSGRVARGRLALSVDDGVTLVRLMR